MGVNRPKSGERITTSSIEDMFTSVTDVINDVKSSNLSASALGPQHLPSIIVDQNASDDPACGRVIFSTEKVISGAYLAEGETKTDILSGNWTTIPNFDLSDGYVLPPCKVLIMMHVSVAKINLNSVLRCHLNQLWAAILYTENTVGPSFSSSDDNVVFDGTNMGCVSSILTINEQLTETLTIHTLIDNTSLTSNWKLVSIQPYFSCGIGDSARGASGAGLGPIDARLDRGELSYCAFYRDS